MGGEPRLVQVAGEERDVVRVVRVVANTKMKARDLVAGEEGREIGKLLSGGDSSQFKISNFGILGAFRFCTLICAASDSTTRSR